LNISSPFIKRPIATSLLAAAILLAGFAAYLLLPVSPLPKVDFPTINVSASLPGANPETMASSVATPLERRFGRIAGVSEITSTSSFGSTSLTLQFDLDRDVDAAGRDVQAAISAAGGELPANMPSRPTFRKVNPSDSPILILSLTSDSLPLGQVYDEANTVLAQKISQVQGVGQVTVGGGQQPAVRVQVDPVALAGIGLSMEDVRKVLSTTTSNQPKGILVGDSRARTVGANDQLTNAAAFKPIVLAYNNGTTVRLSDVANVFDDVENGRVAGWADGTRAVVVIIRRQPGANIIQTIDRVKALLPSIATNISPAIKTVVAVDRAGTIRASVDDVEHTLVLSVILVTAVVFVFLRTWRATAIPSVTVPISLVGTFGLMYLANYSLDNLSLMALTISTGFVVDDAIVVTENIMRFIELGDSPMAASLKGAKQIGFTIVSITVSLLAVFIPLLLMGGIVGRLFREFAVTLSMAIAVSAIVSLTLTPMMCSRLLKHEHGPRGKLYNWSEGIFDAVLRAYDVGLQWVIRHRAVMLLLTVFAVGLTVVLFKILPQGLFPQQDTGMITGFSDAPQDVSFPSMFQRQLKLNAIVHADPDVDHFISFIGGGAGNTGSMFIGLKSKPARKASADEIINRLRPKLMKVEGINLFLQSIQDVRVGGRLARTQYQYTLEDANLDELKHWAPKVLARMKKIPELADVNTDQQTNGLQLDVTIDRDTASRLGLSPQSIDDTLYDAYGQRQVATFFTEVNEYRVVMEVKPEFLQNPDSINSLYVKAGQTSVAGTALGGAASGPVGSVGGAAASANAGSGQSGVTAVSVASTTAGGSMIPDAPNTTIGTSGIGSQVGIAQSTSTLLRGSSGFSSNATAITSQVGAGAQPIAISTGSSSASTGAPSPNQLIPFSAFTKMGSSSTSLSINHQGQFPAITLAFNLAPGKSLSDAITAIHKVEGDLGVPQSLHANFQGTAQAFQSSLNGELMLLIAALVTVYIVLGVLYESLVHPWTILSSLPSAGVGAFLALLICGKEFSVIALIGIILLIGIVKKNAIMMVDFALEAEREQGISREEAIHQACLLRFRPIMMTTMAALLGGLPLALGNGTGAELRQPLGITIVGGLVVSQMLTLFSVPVIYLVLDQLSTKRTRALHGPSDDPPPSMANPALSRR
jgi:multidrug efflux pump subunit AcrB